jgi:ABC-type glycerol-3-phosphate transport system substrate-binding protein
VLQLCACLLLFLASCTPSDLPSALTPQPTLAVGETPDAPRVNSEVPRTLTVFVPAPEYANELSSAFRSFEKANSGVSVKVLEWLEPLEIRSDNARLKEAIDTSDVVLMLSPEVGAYAELGWIANLDPVVRGAPENIGSYVPGTIEFGRLSDGRLYGLPLYWTRPVIVFDRSLLSQADVNAPTEQMTTAEFAELARKVSTRLASQKKFGVSLDIHRPTNGWFNSDLIWLFLDNTPYFTDGKSTFDNPATVEGLRQLKRALTDDSTSQPWQRHTTRTKSIHDDFNAGAIAMQPDTGYFADQLIRDSINPQDKFVVAAPTTNGEYCGRVVDNLLAISRGSRNSDLALAFIVHLQMRETQKKYLTRITKNSPLMSTFEPSMPVDVGATESAMLTKIGRPCIPNRVMNGSLYVRQSAAYFDRIIYPEIKIMLDKNLDPNATARSIDNKANRDLFASP